MFTTSRAMILGAALLVGGLGLAPSTAMAQSGFSVYGPNGGLSVYRGGYGGGGFGFYSGGYRPVVIAPAPVYAVPAYRGGRFYGPPAFYPGYGRDYGRGYGRGYGHHHHHCR